MQVSQGGWHVWGRPCAIEKASPTIEKRKGTFPHLLPLKKPPQIQKPKPIFYAFFSSFFCPPSPLPLLVSSFPGS